MAKTRYPSAKELKTMSEKLALVKGSYILPSNAGAVDKAKYDVCKHILVYMHREDLSQRQLAEKIGVPETRISEVVHYRINKFTLDRLIEYYEKLNPKVSVEVM